MPNPIKEAILNRGWAGKTITRAETVERLNPILLQFLKLNHNYQYVIRSHSDSALTDALKRVQKTARADVGKLSETVLSCGGTPENGTKRWTGSSTRLSTRCEPAASSKPSRATAANASNYLAT